MVLLIIKCMTWLIKLAYAAGFNQIQRNYDSMTHC